ncbi:39S ribosomal protein L43, mitochondrial [Chiroxiphia lanceolata]|nr:PREDICTED: 39S ribosomal protein L43, mitochondrial [Lepidothrix coronata]XP_032550631.1 39S ribosomal protein L43, mitochondrial [Chiroxiphia lanceolata]XP_051655989.1 39S ribosomal protein L43, mitochondrial [Manacus candei]
MTGRGSPSRFLTAVLHNGVGRYVRQLQRLQFLFSPTAADARGARQFVEEAAQDFARQHPDVVLYVSPGSGTAPLVRAEYLNGTVREELIASKTSEEIVQLVTKLANQSGLDIIRIRKPFHTDNPSVQGQWHPLTNKPSILTVQGPRLQPQ